MSQGRSFSNLSPHYGSLISLYFIFYDPKIFARLYLTIRFSKSICNPIRRIVSDPAFPVSRTKVRTQGLV